MFLHGSEEHISKLDIILDISKCPELKNPKNPFSNILHTIVLFYIF
jgi:hypothetical protein